MLFLSDSSFRRVLSLSCGFTFPPMFPEFFRSLTAMYDVFTRRFCFRVNLETCQFIFYIMNVSNFISFVCNFFKVYVFKGSGFN